MRQLLPPVDAPAAVDIDPVAAYADDARRPHDGRPWLLMNMIASTDGATAVDGRSGALGGPADKAVFAAIRAVPDVIVVAAGTVRAERYGPPKPSARVRELRRARGQREAPRVAVVSRTVDLDPHTSLFEEAEEPPLLIVPETADPDRLARFGARAQVLRCGLHEVAMPEALTALHGEGLDIALLEGGPSLNGVIVAEELVDELCLTISPALVAGSSARIAHGERSADTRLQLRHVLEQDDLLFLRYTR